jgi:hypothetical protein
VGESFERAGHETTDTGLFVLLAPWDGHVRRFDLRKGPRDV